MELTADEKIRYSRQTILPEIGKAGQQKMKEAKVLIVGVGGLGSPAALYLAAGGVGTIGIIDNDKVAVSNLQRQIIHTTSKVDQPKVFSAQETIENLNPKIAVHAINERFSQDNALSLVENYDVVIDGTDNFPARYLINDACYFKGTPFIYGGVLKFEGQCSVFNFNGGPCYRCFFHTPPAAGDVPNCQEAGVLGVLPGIIGLLQATEAIKLICGIGRSLSGTLILYDGLNTKFREISIKKDPACPLCGTQPTISTLEEYSFECPNEGEKSMEEVTVHVLKAILASSPDSFCLVDVREQQEWEDGHLPGAVHKPLSELEENYHDIPADQPVYIYCQKGGRGQKALHLLKTKGYDQCVNVIGGLEAWVQEIDPNIATE